MGIVNSRTLQYFAFSFCRGINIIYVALLDNNKVNQTKILMLCIFAFQKRGRL